MTDGVRYLQLAIGPLLLVIPLCYALAAALSASRAHCGLCMVWNRALLLAHSALGLALCLAVSLTICGDVVFHLPTMLPLGSMGALALSVRLDLLTAIMLVLVTFIGVIILRFSRRYLDGDPGQVHYVRWFMATLAAVTLLVISNNMLLLALAWIGSSLALHQLLTFYPDRPQALVAAHKKFLASRVADLCLLGGCVLIGLALGSFEMNEIFTRVSAMPALPTTLQWAGVLLALAAVLKCSQLPMHGWLIQVMEAPTPVSALLHAGIVNIGGFLMIRMSPLMIGSEAAQALLVIVGSLTAVIAALTMMTRISIKVMLAWSTCAQMGFMLMQCGLGAYELAALHLVGHSLYKAHAFLSSGSVVEQYRLKLMSPAARHPGLAPWLAALASSSAIVALTATVANIKLGDEPALWALAWIVTVALTTLLVQSAPRLGWGQVALLTGASVAVASVYFIAHAVLLAVQVTPLPIRSVPSHALVAWVIACFSVLFVLHGWIRAYPGGRLSQALYPHLFAGLYLDELFTRLTFRIWPAKRLGRDARIAPASAHPLQAQS